jgi:hypothetical protein
LVFWVHGEGVRGNEKEGNSTAEPAGQGSVLEDVISLLIVSPKHAEDVYTVINSYIFI